MKDNSCAARDYLFEIKTVVWSAILESGLQHYI